MADTYQAIFDAVRSKIGNGDIGAAVETAVRESFSMAHHLMTSVAHDYSCAAHEGMRPSVLYRPSLTIDGGAWCALYGRDLQSGVAGFGSTPAAAMTDFDVEWSKPLTRPLEAAHG
ncbi:MAG: hypothetical protein EOO29_43185 [Comamonadaceae bacterium]|nr:MAG: hypothetical protein EOO29_43185 [Comamonadaceae bacterium]